MEEAEAAAAAGGGAAMRSVPLPERFDSTNGGWGLGGTGIRPAAKAPSKSRRAMSMTSSSLNNPYAPSDGGAVRGGGEFSNQSNYFAGTLRSGDVRSSSGAMIPGRRGTTSSQKSLASSTVGAKAPAAASNSNSKGIFRAVEEVKVTKGVGSADPAFLKRVNSMSLTSSPRSGASVRAINPATRERK
ncbi:uncharacterized protein MICPUCDRAFT_68838 [Micromonas pusilla CCMP1545]|uniref:Predicted protein n=1 Tax=Micromonas pusilla (strain CCMP1545) TaxID=564608 RepID=C1MY85_MICPC|nr:uncharacterized protein MICPUCDRAFT_68838 [Micromonas pusilla CCMP1545]EEH55008.1 predicted protein [Micromonas pusilla CCMP1545]|eukprot:XP_003060239.1 predicted protein [Micromonas pusilla CCMP1545]